MEPTINQTTAMTVVPDHMPQTSQFITEWSPLITIIVILFAAYKGFGFIIDKFGAKYRKDENVKNRLEQISNDNREIKNRMTKIEHQTDDNSQEIIKVKGRVDGLYQLMERIESTVSDMSKDIKDMMKK